MKYALLSMLCIALGSGALCTPIDNPGDPAEGCSDPVPLSGTPDPALPGQFVVMFHEGVDGPAETQRLAAKYGFVPLGVFENFPGFAGELSPDAVAGLQCEPSVWNIAHAYSLSLAQDCLNPIPVSGTPDPALPGQFVVMFHEGVDGPAETERLAAEHGFVPRGVFESFPGFAGELSPGAVAALRCESSVRYIAYDHVAMPPRMDVNEK